VNTDEIRSILAAGAYIRSDFDMKWEFIACNDDVQSALDGMMLPGMAYCTQ